MASDNVFFNLYVSISRNSMLETASNVGGYTSTLGYAVLAGKLVGPVSYIPLLGVVGGLFKLVMGIATLHYNKIYCEKNEVYQKLGKYKIFRGLTEISGFGLAWAVYDIVTLFKNLRKKAVEA